MMRIDRMIKFFKIRNLLRTKISLSLDEIIEMYPFLSKGEAELLYIKLQRIKNPNFEYRNKKVERRSVKKKMVPTEKKEKTETVKQKTSVKEFAPLEKKSTKAPNRYDENTKRKVLALYNSGKNVKTIAKETGVGHKACRRWLKKFGISSPNNKH